MESLFKNVALFLLASISISTVMASGETSFPSDWKSWKHVNTPLTEIGALPGCDADVSSLPSIYAMTVETYCNVRPQGPGAVDVLVKPSVLQNYKTRNGKMSEGSNMILQLKDLGLLFVTGYSHGKPVYSVFKEDGTDLTASDADSILSAETCRNCHSGYEAFCVNGQCGSAK